MPRRFLRLDHNSSMSLLAWIDFDEAERERTQRIMALGQERESRDELGLGAIRDSIADHLFPGTSTIQTRLRYMLFIPWIFRQLESREAPPKQLQVEARNFEFRLGLALQKGGEATGVFGRSAGIKLRRLPSDVYWAGLGNWGIRNFQGSLDALFSALVGRARMMRHREKAEGNDDMLPPFWHPKLPQAPSTFLETASFQLTLEEADFFRDRLVASNADALLTWLARQPMAAHCEYIWMHPALADFPKPARILVRHAEIFSSLMHGAALLYNLTLSELLEWQENVELYQQMLAEWSAELDLAALKAWELDAFWSATLHPAHTISHASRRFVREWASHVLAGPGAIANSPAARQLVRTREEHLKGRGQSRYLNQGARDRWGGSSGIFRFDFRWRQAQSHLLDIANGN